MLSSVLLLGSSTSAAKTSWRARAQTHRLTKQPASRISFFQFLFQEIFSSRHLDFQENTAYLLVGQPAMLGNQRFHTCTHIHFEWKREILLIAFVFLYATGIHAQKNQLIFHQLQTQNGLSLNSVTCIEIDSLGFVWTGTQDGLNRFDGQQNRIFRNKDGLGLPGDYIHNVFAIKGELFIGTSKGVVT